MTLLPNSSSSSQSSCNDFDFFIGTWTVQHRRLNERLVDCAEWSTFAGSTSVQKILGGLGNVDDNGLALGGEYRAATIRSFNPKTNLWAIWWLDARNPHYLDVPVVGQFCNDVGLFYADDVLNGLPIKVRFMWTLPAPDQPRWEQAFSLDAGVTWETNWVMEFTRANT